MDLLDICLYSLQFMNILIQSSIKLARAYTQENMNGTTERKLSNGSSEASSSRTPTAGELISLFLLIYQIQNQQKAMK